MHDNYNGVIIPRETVAVLQKVIAPKSAPETVVVRMCEGRTSFSVGAVTIATRNIDGTFPDYGRVVPQNPPARIGFETKALAAALRKIRPFASERNRPTAFNFEGGKLTLSVRNYDTDGAASVEVPCTYDDERWGEFAFGVNADYFLAFLDTFGGDRSTISLGTRTPASGPDNGGPIRLYDDGEPAATAVVMPIRV